MKELLQKKLNGKKGFTLAELLIVVAILAVLVAVAIPVFGGALDKAAVATDDANLRTAKGEVVYQLLLTEAGGTPTTAITTGQYYDYNNDSWGTVKVAGKSSANKSLYIKATFTSSKDIVVEWAS